MSCHLNSSVPPRWKRLFKKENKDHGVRIGDCEDLNSTECVELLNTIMPAHVKTRKLYQRMFIRSVFSVYTLYMYSIMIYVCLIVGICTADVILWKKVIT